MARASLVHCRIFEVRNANLIQRFHRDITPDNILVFSKGSPSAHDVIFKLADLGFCHFRQYANSEGEATQRDRGGTREYGVWNSCGKDKFNISQVLRRYTEGEKWIY
jgi:serine/threonine protein kinase